MEHNMIYKTIEYRGGVIEIRYDDDADGPRRDQDNLGIIEYVGKYTIGDKEISHLLEEYDGWAGYEKYLREELGAVVILPIYLYSHSGETIRTTPFGDSWDSGRAGVMYTTAERVKMMGLENEGTDKIEELLRGEVAAMDLWLGGSVFRFDAYVDGEEVGNCGRYYGDIEESGIINDAQSDIDYFLEERARDERVTKAALYGEGLGIVKIAEEIKQGKISGEYVGQNGEKIEWEFKTKMPHYG